MELYKGPFFLSLAAAIWGGMYVVSKFALGLVPPFTLLALRYVIASLFLGIICLIRGELRFPRTHVGLVVQVGLVGYFVSIAAQFIGTDLSSAHLGAVVTTLSPLFLSLFALLLFKEKLSWRQGLATLGALAGVLIMLGGPGETSGGLVGGLVLLVAAVTWGYYSALSRQASRYYTPLQLTTLGLWIATLVTLPTAWFIESSAWHPQVILSPPVIWSVLYLGLISTALAFFLWNRGLQLTPAHQAGVFFFFQPLVGCLLGWAILGETLTIWFLLGSLLVLAGVYINLREEQQPGS
jgi:drug/metabolite transporter (DMT)-like permease